MMPMTAAAHGCTNAQGAVIATRPASMPFAIIPGSGCDLRTDLHPEHRDDCTEGGRECGVDCDDGEPVVGRREGRCGVEPEPAEQQDERPEHRHRDVMGGEHTRFAVRSVLPDPWSEDRARRPNRRHRPSCGPRPNRRSRRTRGPCLPTHRAWRASRRPTSTHRTAGSRSRRRTNPSRRTRSTSTARPWRRSGSSRSCP